MAYPLSAYIALRYSTAGKHNSFVAFINRFSVAGIALGLMSLIIVLSVMNGFEAQLRQRILGIVPQVVAHNASVDDVLQLPLTEVRAASPFREAEGLVQSRQALRGVQLQGVDPATMAKHSIVSDYMLEGNFERLEEIKFGAIISRALAQELSVNVGDQIRVMAAGASVYTPFGRMSSQMAAFLDQAGGLWARGALNGKVGGAFTSTASQHGGQEVTLFSIITNLMHFGMTIVGLDYGFQGQMEYWVLTQVTHLG